MLRRESSVRHVVEVQRVFVLFLQYFVVNSVEGCLIVTHGEVIKATKQDVELHAVNNALIVEIGDEVTHDVINRRRDLEIPYGVELQLA